MADRGPNFDWVEVKSKKNRRVQSPVPVHRVFNRLKSDLNFSTAQAKQSVFSRLDFSNVPLTPVANTNHACAQVWVPRSPVHQADDEHEVDLSLNLGTNFKPVQNKTRSYLAATISDINPILTGANHVPIGAQASANPRPSFGPCPESSFAAPCTRCLSSSHHKGNCSGRIRCVGCFRLGHMAQSYQFPPRFPGLSEWPLFSSQVEINCWDKNKVSRWFKESD